MNIINLLMSFLMHVHPAVYLSLVHGHMMPVNGTSVVWIVLPLMRWLKKYATKKLLDKKTRSMGFRYKMPRIKGTNCRFAIGCLYPNDRSPISKRSFGYTQIQAYILMMYLLIT